MPTIESPTPITAPRDEDVAAIDRMRAFYGELRAELAKVIIGQEQVIELMTIAILGRGHGWPKNARCSRSRLASSHPARMASGSVSPGACASSYCPRRIDAALIRKEQSSSERISESVLMAFSEA